VTIPRTHLDTRPAGSARLSLGHVLRAEWIKLTSLRSTWALLISGAAFTLLSGLARAATAAQAPTEGRPPEGFDAVAVSTTGVSTLAFLVAVVGVLQVTGEVTTGLGRTTFAAVPRRGLVVAAKAAVLGLLAAPVTAVSTAVTLVACQAVLGSRDLGVPVLSLDSAQVVVGAAGYAVAVGVFGQLSAWLLRSTIGAAFALLGLLTVLAPLLGLLPAGLSTDVVPFLPGEAAAALLGADPTGASLSGVVAVPVTVAWCTVALLLASRVLRRRDA
jgi:ABC-2 type transport system permease protein